MATTANLTWAPAGGVTSQSQDIQYKQASSSTWITYANVAANVSSASITGLTDDIIYDFRVVNNCQYAGPTPATPTQNIKITCPAVTIFPGYDKVDYSFIHLGADITRYVVDLLNASDSVLLTNTFDSFPTPVASSFTGLTPSTNYKLRITVYAGATFTFNRQCDAQNFATSAPPTCDAPTIVVASLS
jgi:hypothetical protein